MNHDLTFPDFDWPTGAIAHTVGVQRFVDARPAGAPRGTFLLVHGEPTWGYVYREWVSELTELGYRVVIPDHLGFGRSDKPVDEALYTYGLHRDALHRLIAELDLRQINLVVQDWGGPIGLSVAVAEPERFRRLFVLNTWLHTAGHDHSEGIHRWREMALDPAVLGGDMPTGLIVAGSLRRPGHDLDTITAVFDAPFPDSAAKAGARRFPWLIPFAQPDAGGATEQARVRAALAAGTGIPVHLVWGDADEVFPWSWARQWAAEIPGATLDRITGAGHFVQLDAARDCLDAVRRHLDGGPR